MRRGAAGHVLRISVVRSRDYAGRRGDGEADLVWIAAGLDPLQRASGEVDRFGMHGSTFGGNVIACRVALEFFDILDELMPSIRETGAYFRMRLKELATSTASSRKFAAKA